MNFEDRLRRAGIRRALVRREPMPQINSAGVSVVKAILRALVKPRYVLMALALAAVTLVVVLSMQSCRSTVPIVIQTHQYQCEVQITNTDGTVDFEACVKSDGHQTDVEAPGGAGDDALDLNTDPPTPGDLQGSERSKGACRWIQLAAFGANPPPPHIVRRN